MKEAAEVLAQVSAIELKPGSLIVIRVQRSKTALEIVKALEAAENLPEGVNFLFQYPPFAEFHSLDEEAMRRLGWQRCKPAG